ncbi:hypothetical protein [Nocardioides sp.]|uniref:hypothetical protein n=1 Tax=Nocardioides sp. TaxID=35761 RepID=UPI0035133B75
MSSPHRLPGPVRWRLRPGLAVLRRGAGVLQVGLDDPCLRVEEADGVGELLAALDSAPGLLLESPDPADPTAPAWTTHQRAALRRLDEAGLLIPFPGAQADDLDRALLARSGPDAERRRRARAALRVVVRGEPRLVEAVHPLLLAAGLRPEMPAPDPDAAHDPAAVHLLLTGGVVDRERVDPLVRAGAAHLVVSGDATRMRVGPLVLPGDTACVRCVDAHEALPDPRRPLLLVQAARAAERRPPPHDEVLDHLALAWAVRDLGTLAEGAEPTTWSATVDLPADGPPVTTAWGRHPECGCSWDALFGRGA